MKKAFIAVMALVGFGFFAQAQTTPAKKADTKKEMPAATKKQETKKPVEAKKATPAPAPKKHK